MAQEFDESRGLSLLTHAIVEWRRLGTTSPGVMTALLFLSDPRLRTRVPNPCVPPAAMRLPPPSLRG